MKIGRILLLLLLSLVLVACSSSNKDKDESEAEVTDEAGGIEVEKGILDVEITLPSSIVGETGFDEFSESMQEIGETEVEKNEDGSVTVKMTKKDHQKLLDQLKEDFVTMMDEMIESEQYPTIEDITYDDSFSNIKMIVTDQESFENTLDVFATLTLGINGLFYKVFDGKDITTDKVVIEIVDDSTDETITEIIYPDAMDELDEGEIEDAVEDVEESVENVEEQEE